jgi:lipopolysaccharide export system permease protein
MKIIDRYVLGKFLTTFFFCLLMMTLIVVVIDWSEHADDFLKSRLSFSRILTDYYAGLIPRINAMLFPLFVFISVIFFTAKMADRTEIVAILSSGVSFGRFLVPYWIGGILLSALLWVGNQQLLPRANTIWSNFETRYIGGALDYATTAFPKNFYFRLDSNSYAGMRYFDTTSRSGGVFFIQRFQNNRLVYNLRAESIGWDSTAKAWQLNKVLERRFNGDIETITTTPQKKVKYNFKPRDLRKDEFLKDRLTTPELKELIRLEKIRGKEGINSLLVERYNRDAIPISVLILTIIGATIASRKVRGGSGFHLAIGVLLSVSYILCSRFSIVFATKGNFHPLLAAWLPNIVFGILALVLYRKAAS